MMNFIRSLFGKETFEESLIGLAKFEYQEAKVYDKPVEKKKQKQEIPLSQMLRRSS